MLLTAACATVPAQAPAFKRAADTPPGKANVYIYRIGAYPTLRKPTITVDGTTVFAPPERSYTVIALDRGQHELKVDWAWDTRWPDLAVPLTVESEDLYIKITGSFDRAEGTTYRAGSYALKVDRAVAEAEMAKCCRYLAPRR